MKCTSGDRVSCGAAARERRRGDPHPRRAWRTPLTQTCSTPMLRTMRRSAPPGWSRTCSTGQQLPPESPGCFDARDADELRCERAEDDARRIHRLGKSGRADGPPRRRRGLSAHDLGAAVGDAGIVPGHRRHRRVDACRSRCRERRRRDLRRGRHRRRRRPPPRRRRARGHGTGWSRRHPLHDPSRHLPAAGRYRRRARRRDRRRTRQRWRDGSRRARRCS